LLPQEIALQVRVFSKKKELFIVRINHFPEDRLATFDQVTPKDIYNQYEDYQWKLKSEKYLSWFYAIPYDHSLAPQQALPQTQEPEPKPSPQKAPTATPQAPSTHQPKLERKYEHAKQVDPQSILKADTIDDPHEEEEGLSLLPIPQAPTPPVELATVQSGIQPVAPPLWILFLGAFLLSLVAIWLSVRHKVVAS
ncbi:MAG: hypothetical protein AAFR59_18975, partial [Bacteroidota bacterium]